MASGKSAGINSRPAFTIRPFCEKDAGQVSIMAGQYFPEKKQTDPRQLKKRLITQLDEPDRSLICSSADGTIHGYLSVKMMNFTFNGSAVTGAIFSDFMADEKARESLVPMRMLQSALKGPQDFSFTEDAGHASRLLWCRLGGKIAHAYSNYYTIPLKPVSLFMQQIVRHRSRSMKILSGAIAGGIDKIINTEGASHFHTANGEELSQRELTGEDLCEGLSILRKRYKLFPSLDTLFLEKLIHSLKCETEYGNPESVALLDSLDRLAGWYICYYQPQTRRCNIIHAECLPGKEEELYAALVGQARTHGCISASGRLAPVQFGSSFSEKTLSRTGGKWSLVHSNDPDILRTIQSGEAFLTRCW